MKVQTLVLGPIFTNTYLISGRFENSLIIDPAAEDDRLLSFIKKSPADIFLTHGHIDHIDGCGFLKKNSSVRVFVHAGDSGCLTNPDLNLSVFLGISRSFFPPDQMVREEETDLALGGEPFRFYHTPGHSPGSSCLYHTESGSLFSGDLIFEGSYGRTDLPGGNSRQLSKSIRKILTLPDQTMVFPGHGENFLLGDYKIYAQRLLSGLSDD